MAAELFLKGKLALVTGAKAGLGLAVAEALAKAGANIVLHDAIPPMAEAEGLASRSAIEALAIGADLRMPEAIAAMMARVTQECGEIDIAVNNAVTRHFAPVEEFPPECWNDALAVNISAPFHIVRLALPAMKKRGWGRIVNMASIYSSRAVANRIDYVTTKAAILGFTRAVAIENARSGVTSNALSPGVLPTPAIESRIAEIARQSDLSVEDVAREYVSARQPSGRFVALESVGAMAAFLCSSAADDITGAVIPIDGGWSAI